MNQYRVTFRYKGSGIFRRGHLGLRTYQAETAEAALDRHLRHVVEHVLGGPYEFLVTNLMTEDSAIYEWPVQIPSYRRV